MNRVCFLPERIFILFSCKILFLKNTNFILEITNLLLKRHHFFLLNIEEKSKKKPCISKHF